MKETIFPADTNAAHIRYGFGSLEVNETIKIELSDSDNPQKIRGHIGAHGQYYQKKFKTRFREGALYVMRTA